MVSTVVQLPREQVLTACAASATSVVVASDNLVTRLGLHDLLGRLERVAWLGGVGNGTQARFAVERLRPDVALVDLRLPMAEWLSLVHDLARAAKLIVVSSSTEAWFVASTLRAGATSFLLHSELTPDHLAAAIVGTGAGEPWLSPAVALTQREPPDVAALSRREVEVLNQLAQGQSNAEIAKALFLSLGTIKNHLHRILPKLGARNRAEAIVIWLNWSKGAPA
jgi:DNA-binding NarL/FixJ family response regulator